MSSLLVASNVLERKKGYADTRVPMYAASELTNTTGGTTPKGEAVANTRCDQVLRVLCNQKREEVLGAVTG